MKFLKTFIVTLVIFPSMVLAQKIELINSGDVIKEAGKLYDSAQYKKATVLLDKISRSDTNYVWSLYIKAISCEADSQYTKALDYCREGLELKTQREYVPEFYNTYGNSLNDMGRRDEALAVFDAAIKQYPSYSLLYYNKGIAMLALKKPKEAEQLFQQALLINPYTYSAHYQLAVAAYQQGKILPCFLSLVGYLSVNPQGKYWSNSLKVLNTISHATEEIIDQRSKSTWQSDENYKTVEEIVLSKAALDPAYKPMISLDDAISRQIQAVFEKLEYSDTNNDFYIQYYLPLYKSVFNKEKFELFINWIFSNVNIKTIQDFNKSNVKQIDALKDFVADYFNDIRATRELNLSKRSEIKLRYHFENGKPIGKGVLSADGKKLTGNWEFCFPHGNLRSFGLYDENGQRQGDFKFYFEGGALKAIEPYKNGKVDGVLKYYFRNGNPSSVENYANGDANGLVTTYFYAGNKQSVANYKNGKIDGEETRFFANGSVLTVKHYTNGVLNGNSTEYYKNGHLKTSLQNVNGKQEGPYKSYDESGALTTEGQYVKDNAEGEWKFYYNSGKLKEKRNYVNDKEEGLHQEFYENGQVAATYNTKKAKIIGPADFFDKNGKLYSKMIYDNGILKSAKYFDGNGKELSSSELKGKSITIWSFTSDGFKKSHFGSNEKGDLDGPDTSFYRSGTVSETDAYQKGELNGSSVSYYMNGNKKNEVNMEGGKNNGYYTSYHVNGKIENEGWIVDGENQGEWRSYDEKGRLTTKVYYKDNDLDGYREEYDPTGNKTVEEKYVGGWLEQVSQYDNGKVISVDSFPKMNGSYKLIYPNGKTKAECKYINGDFDGKYVTYYFDGSVESVSFYKRGLRDSAYVHYYYGGNKNTEGTFTLGVKTGTWKFYEEDGKLSGTTQYKNDEINGEKVYYFPDGTKDQVSLYKADLLDGPVTKYEPGGTMAYQVNFESDNAKSYTYLGKDGKLVPNVPIDGRNGSFKSFFANGKPSRECTYTGQTKNGPDILYYSNGQLRSVDTTSFDTEEGISKEYYLNGKLKSVYYYRTGNAEGICREYNKDGNLAEEITFDNGERNGPDKYYDDKGKLVKMRTYVNGELLAVKNEE